MTLRLAVPTLMHMKKTVPRTNTLGLLIAVLLSSTTVAGAQEDLLFLPRTVEPFMLFSAAGSVIAAPEGGPWPSILLIETDGRGSNVQVSARDLPAFNLVDRSLELWVRIENLAQLNEFWVYAASDAEFENRAVFMLSDARTELVEGEWMRVRLSAQAAQRWGLPDLSALVALQFWSNDHGASPVRIAIGPIALADTQPTLTIAVTPPEPIAEWTAQTYFQAAPAAESEAPATIVPSRRAAGLTPEASGRPESAPTEAEDAIPWSRKATIDFSMDWRMVWGSDAQQEGFFSQMDDLGIYLSRPLATTTMLHMHASVRTDEGDDPAIGAIESAAFRLRSLYVQQTLPHALELLAGYFSPDPVHKWLQVTRSAGIEPAFGQDMTPNSLYLMGRWRSPFGVGVQAAVNPDVIGLRADGYRTNTAQEELGMPLLFGSVWYDREPLQAELAATLNGDALKVAAMVGTARNVGQTNISGTMGAKFATASDHEFKTYPLWDHIEGGALRLSGGVSAARRVGSVFVNGGAAYQFVHYSESESVAHRIGIDAGVRYGWSELYTVLSLRDPSNVVWKESAGIEAGVIVEHAGVEFIAGYTMGGFHTLSGLYGNTDLNGAFLRVKATYW